MIDNSNKKVELYQQCIKFNGYKPCAPYKVCEDCNTPQLVEKRILVISLLGLGAVLMASSVLQPLKREYKSSKITFLTSKAAVPIMENNQYIDELIVWNPETVLFLSQIKFDIVVNLDRTRHVSALANIINADKKYGFGLDSYGSINYFNEEFEYLYKLGIDDKLRFKINTKSMAQIMVESLGLAYQNEPYTITVTSKHESIKESTFKEKGIRKDAFLIGINTGCSDLMPLRKLPRDANEKIIKSLIEKEKDCQVLLLGGKEEEEINQYLSSIDKNVINLTNTKDLSYGIAYTSMCDIVFSGCSLGLHMGIAVGKPCVAWFGPSCEQEVQLFFGGKKFKADVECAPCWQKTCNQKVLCNTRVHLDEIVEELLLYKNKIHK
ncbi:glycosyltransferase family 9 protein [Clostridium sp. BNL1100]|uniref:glycosyltransferase family 9 protein n=1 Tax=Clostridium sp. BNL1100 TaxID=755731 RepID=UPI00024A773A|nr:glycosyltransferase family 9 protein [Clostridium sp. BNL1100]AEY67372.1 ADP-heptose:LPS heptosyltransferase [Clostridium sp. BNL1100]